MGWQECTSDRAKRCTREEDDGYNQCTEERDDGYNECTESRDEGYNKCCDWAPCSWFCKAWVWVSNIVCVVWTWISNIVCVVWTWISNIVCVAWVYVTAAICLIPGIGKYITDFLDAVVRIGLAAVGSVIRGILDFVAHPIASVGTIISLFQGCPSVRAEEISQLQIIAHHGAPLDLPENTIQSCDRALELGANALEVDICMTSDEKLILWHDWDPDGLISITRQIELAQTDNAFKPHVPPLGSEWRKPTIDLTLQQFREHFSYEDERDAVVKVKWEIDHGPIDLTIPTLDEFFRAAQHWPKLRALYIDVKMPATAALRYAGPMTDQIHTLISNIRELQFDVIMMVPDSLTLQVMKARAQEKGYALSFTWDVEFPPGVVLNPGKYSAIDHATSSQFHNSIASVGRPVATLFPWKMYRRTIEYDVGRWNQVNSDAATYNAGVRIKSLVAWTIDETDEMNCLAKMGVSGIITNKIADLASVAAALGRI